MIFDFSEIRNAYSRRDDESLASACKFLVHQLTLLLYGDGLRECSLLLKQDPSLVSILNKVAAEGDASVLGKLSFQVGFLSAFIMCVEHVAQEKTVEEHKSRLSNDIQEREIQIVILRLVHSQGGMSDSSLIDFAWQRMSVSKETAELLLKGLVYLGLIEKVGENEEVIYRTSFIGSAVIASVMKGELSSIPKQ